MDATKLRYNMKEIAAASGIEIKTLQTRRTALAKAGEIESGKGKTEYTYDEVKKLCRRPRKPGEPRAEYITALRQQLQTDGYQIKKEEAKR